MAGEEPLRQSERPLDKSMDSRTVQVVLAVPRGHDTADDAAIASALQDEEDSFSEHQEGHRHDRDSPPSAPPLPESGEVVVVSYSGGSGGEAGTAQLEAVSRRDEQLARELQEEELEQLNGEERGRIGGHQQVLLAKALPAGAARCSKG